MKQTNKLKKTFL